MPFSYAVINTFIAAAMSIACCYAGDRAFAQDEPWSDLDFGAPAVNVMGDMPRAWHQYWDVPAWNADSTVLLITGGEDGKDLHLVRDFASDPKHERLPDLGHWYYARWSQQDPSILYYIKYDAGESRQNLYSYNIDTGDTNTVLSFKAGVPLKLMDIHADGAHALFGPRARAGTAVVYNINTGERKWARTYEQSVHRTRFTNAPDLSVWTVYSRGPADHRRWLITPDGTQTALKNIEGHITASPDGTMLAGTYDGRNINFVDITDPANPELVKSIYGIQDRSHLTWAQSGDWLAIDVSKGYGALSDFGGSIVRVDVANDYEITELARHHSDYVHSERGSLQHWHPHVDISPDEKYIVFNSSLKLDDPDYATVFVVSLER